MTVTSIDDVCAVTGMPCDAHALLIYWTGADLNSSCCQYGKLKVTGYRTMAWTHYLSALSVLAYA